METHPYVLATRDFSVRLLLAFAREWVSMCSGGTGSSLGSVKLTFQSRDLVCHCKFDCLDLCVYDVTTKHSKHKELAGSGAINWHRAYLCRARETTYPFFCCFYSHCAVTVTAKEKAAATATAPQTKIGPVCWCGDGGRGKAC